MGQTAPAAHYVGYYYQTRYSERLRFPLADRHEVKTREELNCLIDLFLVNGPAEFSRQTTISSAPAACPR